MRQSPYSSRTHGKQRTFPVRNWRETEIVPTFRNGGQQIRQDAGRTGRTSTRERDSSTPAVRALQNIVSAGIKNKLRYSSFTHQVPLCTTQKTVRVTNFQLLFKPSSLLLFTTSTLRTFFASACVSAHSIVLKPTLPAHLSKKLSKHFQQRINVIPSSTRHQSDTR